MFSEYVCEIQQTVYCRPLTNKKQYFLNIILNRKGADQVLATYSSDNPFIEPLKASKETYHTDTKGESKNSTEIAENNSIGLDS